MSILILIAQLVLGVYFLFNAANHLITNRAGIVGYAQARNVPAPGPLVFITGLMLLGAGLSLLLGFKVTVGAWLAIIFLILASFLVHHFWTDQGMQRVGEQVNFAKNLALASALLLATYVPKEVWVIGLNP